MQKPAYGQDAPGVVRWLAFGGLLLAVTALAAHSIPHRFGVYTGHLWQPAVAVLATAAWMVWSSQIGKQLKIRALLDRYKWRGDEIVLDIGCGRGLATIASAQRLRLGRVVGVDLWRSRDLSGNTPDAARANADVTGVRSRVSFETGDATALPFEDATFDIVVSMTALHNIPSAAGRRRATEEALRVLRPGGTLLIFDILHTPRYAATARATGAEHVWLSSPAFLWALPGWSMTAKKISR